MRRDVAGQGLPHCDRVRSGRSRGNRRGPTRPVGRLVVAGMLVMVAWAGRVSGAEPNYDESKVPAYKLPDPLICEDGTPVRNRRDWERRRRPELLWLFEEHVYGRAPTAPPGMWFERAGEDAYALGGRATRREVTLWLRGDRGGPKMDLLLYLPRGRRGPVPVFLGLNFMGNHTVHPDPGIRITTAWVPNDRAGTVVSNRATAASRGWAASRWPVERILERGYGLVTAYCGDLEPDHPEGWKLGVRAALSLDGTNHVFRPDEWGAIAAWAWGLSRAMDYLEGDRDVDARRVVLIGHSRLGKTALWAGARDRRFAIVISNESGEGGAALTRRRYGERIADLNRRFPHWFCGRYKSYDDREDDLPVDAHELIALMAPRPVYIGSAVEDRWADPRGEFLAGVHAEPVYRLYGLEGLGVTEWPPMGRSVGRYIGYHVREGRHDLTAWDWERYLDFADRHLRGR